ncbi:biogenesis protein MshI [Glaciecola sp. 1036]|uniref:biogenesis protein MshI n=1 Tax=Alteromonadaceae TaxID=72275 RepID=UPI003D087B6C
MQISWKDVIRRKFLKPSKYQAVGLAFTAEQVLLCAFKETAEGVVWELDASFSHKNWQHALADYVKKNKLQGAPCYFNLTAHWYRVMQIDRPDVADEDLFAAIRWPLQEIAGTNHELVYDYADLPVQVSGQNKLLVVALAKTEIEKLSEAIFKAELNLQSVSVEEFATTQLAPPSKDAVITLVQEHGEEVVLNIVKENKLYFSRQLKGFENIGSFSESELDMGIIESLCVQIQRSMDFFESQLRQAPVKRVLLKLDTVHTEFLANKISAAMGVSCENFLPNIKCAGELNFKMASFSCLGAAFTHFNKKMKTNKKEVTDEASN